MTYMMVASKYNFNDYYLRCLLFQAIISGPIGIAAAGKDADIEDEKAKAKKLVRNNVIIIRSKTLDPETTSLVDF